MLQVCMSYHVITYTMISWTACHWQLMLVINTPSKQLQKSAIFMSTTCIGNILSIWSWGNNYLFSAPWYMWQCYKSSNGGIMICLQGNHSGVMWVLRHYKTWATQLLVQKFVPVHNEQIIKVLHYQTFAWGTHWWLWFHSHKVLVVWQLFPCNGITMKWELGICVIYSC